MAKTLRSSNIEALRIVSMLAIVLSHSSYCVSWGNEAPACSRVLQFGAELGVNCFVLISGYFMVLSRVTLSKIVRLWLTVFTYSAGIYLLALMVGVPGVTWDSGSIYRYCFPFVSGHYWFVSTFIFLMLLTPFLNVYIKACSKRFLLYNILALQILIFIGWQQPVGEFCSLGRILGFCLLYMMAAFLRLHCGKLKEVPARYWFLIFLAIFAAVEFCCVLGSPMASIVNPWQGNLLMQWLSVIFFMGFLSLRIGSISWVNAISSCVFGVYLIHCHHSIGWLIWNKIFAIRQMAESVWLIPYCLMVTLGIYVVATLVEAIRQKTLETAYEKWVSRWLQATISQAWGKVKRVIIRLEQKM